jgi:hypothetical protein
MSSSDEGSDHKECGCFVKTVFDQLQCTYSREDPVYFFFCKRSAALDVDRDMYFTLNSDIYK